MENTKKKQQTVYVLCGCPGSGKSTWINQRYVWDYDALISRDSLRFNLLKPGEDYFSKESIVREMFYEGIEQATSPTNSNPAPNIFIDATHLSPVARAATRCHINGCPYQIAVSVEVPLNIALERNALRTGRALVPESAIYNMYKRYEKPTLKEGFDEIWHIDAEGNIVKEVKS